MNLNHRWQLRCRNLYSDFKSYFGKGLTESCFKQYNCKEIAAMPNDMFMRLATYLKIKRRECIRNGSRDFSGAIFERESASDKVPLK